MSPYRRLGGYAATHGTRSHGGLGALRLRRGGSLTALALVVSLGVWTPPALAASFGWAYLWANQPTSPSYTPALSCQFNDTGATNMITRSGVGAYGVQLSYQNLNSGDVQVIPYGTGAASCKVTYWTP